MIKLAPLLCFLMACSEQTDTQNTSLPNKPSLEENNIGSTNRFTWRGLIKNKIPVFLHYTVKDEIIVGQIFYLNTKSKMPIRVIGTIEEDKSYRLLEFEPNGNISGILRGTPAESFEGSWFSPETREEFLLNLKKIDTAVAHIDPEPAGNDIAGHYHYQYSEAGSHGDLEIKNAGSDKVSFSIYSVTEDPARNLAEVPIDTVNLVGNSFIYTIPDSDSCEFKVTFFKGFAAVEYTRGYCDGQFGMNATVDGIFLKVRK